MAVSPNLIDAMQTKYQNSIRALAKEAKGGKLRPYAEKAIGKNQQDVIFYRSEEGTVHTGELNMYDPAWASTAGKIIKNPKILLIGLLLLLLLLLERTNFMNNIYLLFAIKHLTSYDFDIKNSQEKQ